MDMARFQMSSCNEKTVSKSHFACAYESKVYFCEKFFGLWHAFRYTNGQPVHPRISKWHFPFTGGN